MTESYRTGQGGQRDDPHRDRYGSASNGWEVVRRAFAEFLWFPTAIVATFLVLAAGFFALERSGFSWLAPIREVLRINLFTDAQSTADLLSTVAGSLITVTSITISLLLVALQQAAGSLTFEVFDQFLRRRYNQFYFGFFVGLALFALITLATVNEPFNPVLAATFALLLTIVALLLLIVLLYTTINQMRPVEIIEAVHHLTLGARHRQLPFVRRTRRHARATGADPSGQATIPVNADGHGFVTRIDLDAIESCLATMEGAVEVELDIALGAFVGFGDTIARISAEPSADASALADATRRAIRLERQRDIMTDPAYGIEQLETIAWTSISTSKSNPAPGMLTIQSLRDLLARWADDARAEATPRDGDGDVLLVVYHDNVIARLFDAIETLAVVSTESMQHQNFIEVLRLFTVMFDRLPPDQQRRTEDVILRMLSGLADHVLTSELDSALRALATRLERAARHDTGAAVETARAQLAATIGKLHSRSTRATGGEQ